MHDNINKYTFVQSFYACGEDLFWYFREMQENNLLLKEQYESIKKKDERLEAKLANYNSIVAENEVSSVTDVCMLYLLWLYLVRELIWQSGLVWL